MVLQSNDVTGVHGNYTPVVCVVGATFVVWSIEDGAMYYRCGKIHWVNVQGFNPTEVFMEILSCFLGQNCLVLKRDT